MNRLILIYTAISTVLAGPFSPIKTPSAGIATIQARQRITLPGSSPALLLPVTSQVTTTFAFYSGSESDGSTFWDPWTFDAETFTVLSSGDFWQGCLKTTIGTDVSIDTNCPLYTACSTGTIEAASTWVDFDYQSYSCYTLLVYSTWAAENPLSSFWYGVRGGTIDKRSFYLTKPPSVVPTLESTITPTTSSIPTSISISTPSVTPVPVKSNNASIIAGSVVGGVVVLCITVIAVVFILRRGRNKINHVQGPLAVRGSSTDLPEKYEGPPPPISGVGAPEYGAHANIHSTSGSPPADSPVPVYELGVRQQSHRKELEA